MTYDVDHKSFIVQVFQLPQSNDVTRLASVMLEATRRIESALIQKLNCAYFVARKVSMPTIEAMMKKERVDVNAAKEMYLNFSQQLNELINLYFSIENEGKCLFKSN